MNIRILAITMMLFGAVALQAQDKKEGPKKDKGGIKTYEEMMTPDVVSTDGLFKVHEIGEDYYYEIPFDMLDKDMLLVSRRVKLPANLGGGFTSAGSKANEQLIQWTRVRNNIHLKAINYSNTADKDLPIYASVQDNNYSPVIKAFKIAAFGPDSTTAIINVNDLFLSDVRALSGVSSRMREQYKVGGLDKSRSFISRVASFPGNIEVRHDLTYEASRPPSQESAATISMQMSQSMYLLPEEPMQPRLFDERVGWFTVSQIDYGSEALKADEKTYIRRWRMVPSDMDAYNRGELVEPVKPIVYYLDPATPTKWRPYFKQGILDWEEAFEAAGFKNAIQVRDAPTADEDPEWSPEDARYSTVRYVASTTRNAMGPSVSDPRTGEIIESDIVWYHNHLRSYRNRYLLETGGANPNARTLDTPEEEIGEMMRRVISHEVGHALGLPHNMKSSYAYPTDSLRSATFPQKWGLATTIMDYTRYNYVAQPEDKGVRWVRMLGPYDVYSIDWGYRYISDARSSAAELPTLDRWIKSKNGDPMFLFGARNSYDPSSQTECIGDDPVLASSYGLQNLKRIAPHLNEWTQETGKGFENLNELYGELISVWTRYVNHVTTNIGGVYELIKTAQEPGHSYTHLSKSEQQRAMDFLSREAFTTPTWMLEDDIVRNIGPSGIVDRIGSMQSRMLRNVLRSDRLMRMVENEALNGAQAYALNDLAQDLRSSIWGELNGNKSIDAYRRNLQRAHVTALQGILNNDKHKTDLSAMAQAELDWIEKKAMKAAKRYKNNMVGAHLKAVHSVINNPPAMEKASATRRSDMEHDLHEGCMHHYEQ